MNERIYQGDDGRWFYRVRGKHAIGPFDSRQQAEQALAKQLQGWSGRRSYPKANWPRSLQPSKIFRRSATRQP